ncbi:MAG TPA: hypothetical protein VNO26_14300 [Candidatus Limnocylindria bacterium]|nr:hypothetical protein [Candidatus Limnocylindria bacterium]
MRATGRPIVALLSLLALAGATRAAGDDAEVLRAENERLRARIAELERENARLRGAATRAEPAIPTRVVEREGDDGGTVWSTEPARVETSGAGRAAHYLWLERVPGDPGATLWIRGAYSGGIYRHTDRLELRLDGRTETLPIADYDATRITAGVGHRPQRRDHETLRVLLDARMLDALAETATLGGQLGRTTFTVPAEALASMRALARKTLE